ncbi:DUF2158 domain-containing protein [Cupriavidus basilensis]|uniref:DUF2158 domain-containing protein n=1 Tax=Cupriavidus basilensis TaxID=68895 RepID=UPI002848419F|nr:DUF2158 domain-containing protein [Cupriavidus basilensis]MDR3382298.1 DUF2158 domain-containing protein [Cupriavidus basilensis]
MADLSMGDVVFLKSGGPMMTIEEIADYSGNGTKSANCLWFVEEKRQSAVFALHTLEKRAN